MAAFDVTCAKCGARYRLLRRPAGNQLKCKKCGEMMETDLPPAERIDRTGQAISGHTILKRLSNGELSDVYRAEQLGMHRLVALKVLGDEFASDTAAVDRFIGLAKTVAGMHHPNIVSIFDVNAADAPYYTMEYVDGSTVAEMVEKVGCPPVPDALRLGQAAGGALTHALRSKARSIRIAPDTVMVNSSGEVKLLPGAFSNEPGKDTPEAQAVVGMGAFLYLLLTGREADPHARKFEPPGKLNPEVADELDDIVLRMLKGPKKGYATAVAATQAIKHYADKLAGVEKPKQQIEVRGSRRPPDRKTLLAVVAAAGVCVAVVAVAAFIIVRQNNINTLLKQIDIAFAQERYDDVIRLGEEFIDSYPSNRNADAVTTWIASSRQKAEQKKRQTESDAAIDGVIKAASAEPLLLKQHTAELEKVGQTYADVPKMSLRVEAKKAVLRRLWQDKMESYAKDALLAVRDQIIRDKKIVDEGIVPPAGDAPPKTFADAYKILEELRKACEQSDSSIAVDGTTYYDQVKKRVDVLVDGEFYRLHNRVSVTDDKEEATKAYRLMIDEWGVPSYAEQARKFLGRFEKGPEKQPDMPPEKEPPKTPEEAPKKP